MVLLVPEGIDSSLLEGLPESVEIAYLPKEGAVSGKALEAEFAISPYGPGAKQLFAALPSLQKLKAIQTLTAGVDWILPRIPAEITLCDGAGIHDVPVSEWIMAGVLGAIKKFSEFRDAQREHRWAYQWVDDLEGATVLFLGYGSIARATEKRLEPFGVRFIRVARTAREEIHSLSELPNLLPNADIVINILPFTPATEKLCNARFFQQMKQGALYVNAGRGKTVDQNALIESIKTKHIRFVSDVTDPEPLPEDDPLWSLPDVFFTPHMAGSTHKLFKRGYDFAMEQVGRFVRNEPLLNVVMREQGY